MNTLKLIDVCVRKKANVLLENISLNWHSGQVSGIIGPNGAGKSTLLKAIARLQQHEGIIDYGVAEQGRTHTIAYVPQLSKAQSALSVFEMVLLGRVKSLYWRIAKQHLDAVEQALRQMGLTEISQQPFYTLSGGQRQMVLLAQAFVSEPQLLLLDEPTSALDLHHQLSVLAIIAKQTKQRNIITLMVIHDLGLALRFCDELTLISKGKLIAHQSASTMGRNTRLAQVFKVGLEIGSSAGGYPYLIPTEIRTTEGLNSGAYHDHAFRT